MTKLNKRILERRQAAWTQGYLAGKVLSNLREQEDPDSDSDMDNVLDDVVVTDYYEPISVDPVTNQDYADNWCTYFPNSPQCTGDFGDMLPDWDPVGPDNSVPDGPYWSIQCDDYGCMDESAYNFNSNAGTWICLGF